MCSVDFRLAESPRLFPEFSDPPQSFNPSGDGPKLFATCWLLQTRELWQCVKVGVAIVQVKRMLEH